jgi:hypothetical protein
MDRKFADIVKRHRPRGYRLVERAMKANHGVTTFERAITCEPIKDRFALFTFLHECGHVHCRHMIHNGKDAPPWREEYEADKYATEAMRAEGVPIPRKMVALRREILRDLIKAANVVGDYIDDEDVLRYAYGRNWRMHK